MNELTQRLTACFTEGTHKLVLSNPRAKDNAEKKLTLEKRGDKYQLEQFRNNQAFHTNMPYAEAFEYVRQALTDRYRQLNCWDAEFEHSLRYTKREKLLAGRTRSATAPAAPQGHNREKHYLLEEGEIIEPLVDMGIFTREGKIVRPMYDKYRQINRFLELVEDEIGAFPAGKELHIVDFGCGKSYLTFILYYYLTKKRGLDVRMTGLDLKQRVIEDCNAAARKYGYEGLHFEVGDIGGYAPDAPVDIVITLHACDTATDFALHQAISWQAPLIMSVPCCQHELNGQMETARLALFTRYGLIRERMAALMTDALRANLLICCGYATQVIEFVDLSHTPKNVLLRARKANISKAAKTQALAEVRAVMEEFGVSPTLYRLLTEAGHAGVESAMDIG